jgi:hypothetical protein
MGKPCPWRRGDHQIKGQERVQVEDGEGFVRRGERADGKLRRNREIKMLMASKTIHFIAKSLPIDPSIEWWTNAIDPRPEDDIMQTYAHYNLRVAELRQDNDKTTTLYPQTPDAIDAVLALLRRAHVLEKEYREWYTGLPSDWKPAALAWVEWSDLGKVMGSDLSNSIVHPGRVDTYKELSVAYVYNVARSSQLLIWTTILRCVAWLSPDADYRTSKEYQKASIICSMYIENIVASVPYFLGWNADTDVSTATRNDGSADDSIKGVSGVFLMWPLFAAATCDFCSDSQRSYLRGRLAFIAENMGICQARILLNVSDRSRCTLTISKNVSAIELR